jgi:hypothetical protein
VLTIFRKDENRTFPVTITREEIRTQSVRSKVVEPGYAWIRLSQFQERTVDDFVTKLEQIYKQEPNLKGWCSTCAMTRAACWMRPSPCPRPSCLKTSPWCPPTASWPKASSPTRLARVLPAPQRRRPAQAPAGGPQECAAGRAGQ